MKDFLALLLCLAFLPDAANASGCAYGPSGTPPGLGAKDKEDCRKHCAYEAQESPRTGAFCAYNGERLPIDHLRFCAMVNDIEERVPLTAERSPYAWGDVRTEAECLAACKAAETKEDKEACFWGEKTLFSDFKTEHRLCRILETGADRSDLPIYPVSREKCARLVEGNKSLDRTMFVAKSCRSEVSRWGNETWGRPSDKAECQICTGWPETCESVCSTEKECRALFAKTAEGQDFAFASWEDVFVQRKGKASQLKNQRCQLLDASGVEVWGDRYDNGRVEDCRRLCDATLTKSSQSQGYTGLRSDAKFPLHCKWDGQELSVVQDICQEHFKLPPASLVAVVNVKTALARVAFEFSARQQQVQWGSYLESADCHSKRALQNDFQVTWDRRAWGRLKTSFLLGPDGRRRNAIPADHIHGAPATLLSANAKASLRKLPSHLHDKVLVLTTSSAPYRDPLELKAKKNSKLDIPAYQKLLVARGLVKTYFKNRYIRFTPKGKWLTLKKAFEGKGGVRWLHLAANVDNEKLGIVQDPLDGSAKSNRLEFFVVEKGKTQTVVDFDEPVNLVDSGDYNGDGRSELVFFAGKTRAGALYLVSDTGEILARQSWGEFDGP